MVSKQKSSLYKGKIFYGRSFTGNDTPKTSKHSLIEPNLICAWLFGIGGILGCYDKIENFLHPQKIKGQNETPTAKSIKQADSVNSREILSQSINPLDTKTSEAALNISKAIKSVKSKNEEEQINDMEAFFRTSNWDKIVSEASTIDAGDVGGFLLFAATLINGFGLVKLGSSISQPSSIVGGIGLTLDSPFMANGITMTSLGIFYVSLAFFFAGLANNFEKNFAKDPSLIREFDISIVKNPSNWILACGNSDKSREVRNNIVEFFKFIRDDQILVSKSTLNSFNQMFKYIKNGFKKEDKPKYLTLSNPTAEQYRCGSSLMAISGPLVALTSGVTASVGHLCAFFASLADNVGVYSWSKSKLNDPDKTIINACMLTKTASETLSPILAMIGASQGFQEIILSLKMATLAGPNLRNHDQLLIEECTNNI